MGNKRQKELHSWANSYTKPVRELTTQQETAMLQSGNLSHYLYEVNLSELALTYGQDAKENVTKNIIMKKLTGTINPVTKKLESWTVIQICWERIDKIYFG